MKKLKYVLFMIPILFGFINTVSADTVSSYYIQDTDSTKSTYWTVGDSWLYENNGILFTDTTDKYFIIETCLTGYLNFEITNNIAGSISLLGEMSEGYCNCQGYDGAIYKYVFKVNQFDISVSGTNPQVSFALRVSNPQSYKVYQDFLTVYSSTYNPISNAETNETLKDMNDNIVDTNNKLDNIDDTLTDSNIDDDSVSSTFEEFNNFLDDNSTITQLITLPITLYTAILNNVGASCQPFSLGSMYGEELVLPCVNIGDYLGSTVWGMIDLIISGFAIYAISKKLIKVFNTFSSMKEGDVIDD